METVICVITFNDEAGSERRLSIAGVKANLSAGDVQAAAQKIITSGVFSSKGKFKAAIKGQLVTTSREVLFGA